MRLASPWSELEKYANDFELQSKDSMERQHVPFIIILLRMLDKWKKEVRNCIAIPRSALQDTEHLLPFDSMTAPSRTRHRRRSASNSFRACAPAGTQTKPTQRTSTKRSLPLRITFGALCAKSTTLSRKPRQRGAMRSLSWRRGCRTRSRRYSRMRVVPSSQRT